MGILFYSPCKTPYRLKNYAKLKITFVISIIIYIIILFATDKVNLVERLNMILNSVPYSQARKYRTSKQNRQLLSVNLQLII